MATDLICGGKLILAGSITSKFMLGAAQMIKINASAGIRETGFFMIVLLWFYMVIYSES
jgi:hypothetical protein